MDSYATLGWPACSKQYNLASSSASFYFRKEKTSLKRFLSWFSFSSCTRILYFCFDGGFQGKLKFILDNKISNSFELRRKSSQKNTIPVFSLIDCYS